MLVLLVPTVQQYLTSNVTIPQQLPNAHKSKGVDENMYIEIYGWAMSKRDMQGAIDGIKYSIYM